MATFNLSMFLCNIEYEPSCRLIRMVHLTIRGPKCSAVCSRNQTYNFQVRNVGCFFNYTVQHAEKSLSSGMWSWCRIHEYISTLLECEPAVWFTDRSAHFWMWLYCTIHWHVSTLLGCDPTVRFTDMSVHLGCDHTVWFCDVTTLVGCDCAIVFTDVSTFLGCDPTVWFTDMSVHFWDVVLL
jgi:hypothetical protein